MNTVKGLKKPPPVGKAQAGKNRKRGLVTGTKPLNESPPHGSEGEFLVPPVKHEKGCPASETVDSKFAKINVAEILGSTKDSDCSVAANVVAGSSGVRFVYQYIQNKDLESETARSMGAVAGKRHVNFHHLMRSVFGSFRLMNA